MTSVRLDLSYHGAGFAGWATSRVSGPFRRSSRSRWRRFWEAPEADRGRSHGRRRARLGAGGQLRVPDRAAGPLARALNALTGDDLTVWSAAPAPEGFDARGDARSRTYCYRVLAPTPSPFERGLSLFWPHKLYPGLWSVRRGPGRQPRLHRLHAATQTEHVRFERNVLSAEWRRGRALGHEQRIREGVELFELWIEADAFMRNMVRVLCGNMLGGGGGAQAARRLRRPLLGGAPREAAGDTARPHGLSLASVRY